MINSIPFADYFEQFGIVPIDLQRTIASMLQHLPVARFANSLRDKDFACHFNFDFNCDFDFDIDWDFDFNLYFICDFDLTALNNR